MQQVPHRIHSFGLVFEMFDIILIKVTFYFVEISKGSEGFTVKSFNIIFYDWSLFFLYEPLLRGHAL